MDLTAVSPSTHRTHAYRIHAGHPPLDRVEAQSPPSTLVTTQSLKQADPAAAVGAPAMSTAECVWPRRHGIENFAQRTAFALRRLPPQLGSALASWGQRVKDTFQKIGGKTVQFFKALPGRVANLFPSQGQPHSDKRVSERGATPSRGGGRVAVARMTDEVGRVATSVPAQDVSPKRVENLPDLKSPKHDAASTPSPRDVSHRHANAPVHTKHEPSDIDNDDSIRSEYDLLERLIQHSAHAKHGVSDVYADDSIRSEYDLLKRLSDDSIRAKHDPSARYANAQILAAGAA